MPSRWTAATSSSRGLVRSAAGCGSVCINCGGGAGWCIRRSGRYNRGRTRRPFPGPVSPGHPAATSLGPEVLDQLFQGHRQVEHRPIVRAIKPEDFLLSAAFPQRLGHACGQDLVPLAHHHQHLAVLEVTGTGERIGGSDQFAQFLLRAADQFVSLPVDLGPGGRPRRHRQSRRRPAAPPPA